MSSPRFHADEIARFNALAAQWWDPEGPMKPLHRLNPMRIAYLRRVLIDHFGREACAMRPFEGLRLLDIGCGAGLVAEPLARMGFAVSAIDLAEENIAVARAHAEAGGLVIDYACRAIETVPEEAGFDAITLLEVVEHVPDVAAMVQEAAARLRPGGMLMASTLNRTLKAYALAILGAEYILRWLPIGTHDWNNFVTPEAFSDAMRASGLIPLGPEGMVYNPLSARWSLSPDCEVNYFLSAIKPE